MDLVNVLTILSSLMLPFNFICTFWIFSEMIDLSDTTFIEMQNDLNSRHAGTSSSRRMNSYIVLNYLLDRSCNPDQTQRLYRFYLTSLAPGALSFIFTPFMALSYSSDTVKIFIVGIVAFFLVNVGLALYKQVYYKKHFDEEIKYPKRKKKKLRKNQNDETKEIKTFFSYIIIAIIFLSVYIFFNLAVAGVSQSRNQSANLTQTTTTPKQIDHYAIRRALTENGYETYEVPTTFWDIEEASLMYAPAGIKEDTKIEFYQYSMYQGGETANGVYQIISKIICENMKSKKEIKLPNTGEMLVVTDGKTKKYVLHQYDTVLYAYTPEGSTQVDEFLAEVDYTEK